MDDHLTAVASAAEFNPKLQGLRYTDTRASKPPIRVTRSTSSLHPEFPLPGDTASHSSNTGASLPWDGDVHPAGPGSISARESQTSTTLSFNTKSPTLSSLTSATVSIPQIRLNESVARISLADRSSNYSTGEDRRWLSLRPSISSPAISGKEVGVNTHGTTTGQSLDVNLPTKGFGEELLATNSIEFSKRGSMLIDGRRVNQSSRKSSPNLSATMNDTKVKAEQKWVSTPASSDGAQSRTRSSNSSRSSGCESALD